MTSQSPATNAVNVAVSANVTVGFNQAVTGTTFAVTGPGGVAVTGTTTYNAGTNVATFTPVGSVDLGHDLLGHRIGCDQHGRRVDEPAVVVVHHGGGAVGDDAVSGRERHGRRDRDQGLGHVRPGRRRAVRRSSQLVGSSSVSGSLALTGSGTVATFTPSAALAPNTTYTVTVSGAIATGSGAMTPLTWTFTTAAAPTVISQSPAAGAVARADELEGARGLRPDRLGREHHGQDRVGQLRVRLDLVQLHDQHRDVHAVLRAEPRAPRTT